MKNEQKFILLIWPRVHTNLNPVIWALEQADFEVKVVVRERGFTENLEGIDSIVADELLDESHNFSEAKFYEFTKGRLPTVSFIRNENFYHCIPVIQYVRSKTQVINYDQLPEKLSLNRIILKSEIFSIWMKLKRKLPLHTMTPVKHRLNQSLEVRWPHKSSFRTPIQTGILPTKKDDQIHVVMVGKFTMPRKRHDWFLNALQEVDLKLKVSIAGAGLEIALSSDKIERKRYAQLIVDQIKSLKSTTPHDITVYDSVPYDQLMSIFSLAHIYVLPSQAEPFAISPLEAMSKGCAVLVPRQNGSSWYIEDGVDGVLYEEDDYSDFLRQFKTMIARKDLVAQIGRSGYQTIRTKHTYEQFVDQFKKAINI